MKYFSLKNPRTAKLFHGEKNLGNSNKLKALFIHSSVSEDAETVFSVTGMRTPQCLQIS
jgi:hypothetical protein